LDFILPIMKIRGLLIVVSFLIFNRAVPGQIPNYDSTFQALFQTTDDSVRTDKLFFLFDDMYLYEPEATAQKFLPIARKMLDEAKKHKNTYGIAKGNQALAYLYKNIRQYDRAYQFAALAEKEWQKSNYHLGLAELKYLRASMMVGNKPQQEVFALAEEALKICKDYHFNTLYMAIGGFLMAQYGMDNQYNKTIDIGREMLKVPDISDRRKLGVYNDLGIALELAGRYQEAREAYQKSLKIHQELGLPLGAVIGNLASLALAEKKLDEALSLALKAETELKKNGMLEHQFSNSELLTKIQTERKEYKSALHYANLSHQLDDSLHQLEKQSEFLNLEKKYQTELKNKTIAEQKTALLEKEQREQRLTFSIFGVVVISVFSGVLFYTNRKRKENKLNQNLAESEMKALRAQMNPHFMFNSLNAIQQMVMNNENENAYNYLNTYSRLTRQILENSEKKWISVKDEMKFLELYLQIESLRFEHAFQYKIEVTDEVMPNSDKIPAMIVQPIVENAIKHGLLNKNGDKNLLIRFDRKDESSPLEVVVEDNGLGRKATQIMPKDNDHHSMSLGITENRLQLLDQQGGSKIEFEDLQNADGSPAGTRVHILIRQPA
jgi:two-component system LytT family sensor kinase